jgi:type IV secretory pathway TraG/TraD family ATPase VirD4
MASPFRNAKQEVDEFYNGYEWNPETGEIGDRVTFDMSSHETAVSPTGSSKGVSLEIPNLLFGLRNSSVVNPDPSGQNAAVCTAARAAMGHRIAPINPMGLHVKQYPDLKSVGFNPSMTLDPEKPAQFFIRAVAIAEATVPKEEGANSKFFYEGARDLGTWLIGFDRLRNGDNANLATCRDWLTEAEFTDADGKVTSGIRFWASEAVANGSGPDASVAARRVASMAGRFMLESRANRDIIATLITAWRFLEDERIRADLSVKNGFDPATLRDHATYAPVILPAGTEQEFFSGWLRLVISCSLDVLYERGSDGKPGVPTIFLLSEAAQYGHMTPLRAALGQGRKYGIRLVMVYQNYGQICDGGHGENGADTITANSGCMFAFSPGNSTLTADFLSRLSGDHLLTGMSASDDLQQGARPSYSLQRERVWSPEKIRSLPERHALVWRVGQAEPTPVYCPPYWDIEACRRVARIDPYHPNSTFGRVGNLGRRVGRAVKMTAAALALAVIAGLASGWVPISSGSRVEPPKVHPHAPSHHVGAARH